MAVFWVVTPYGLQVGSSVLEKQPASTCRIIIPPTNPPAIPHVLMTQKTNIDIFTAVRTSYLMSWQLFSW
jgi:hypothetical protein